MTAAIQRVRVVLPIDARSTQSTAPLPPLPVPVGHRKTERRLADPINTITVAELRWREDTYVWRCPRVAAWIKVSAALLLLLTTLVVMFAAGVQHSQGDDGSPPAVAPQVATTVPVPVPGGAP